MGRWGVNPRKGPFRASRPGSRGGPAGARRPSIPKYYRWPEVGRTVQIHLGAETLPHPTKIVSHDTSADCLVVAAPGGTGYGSMIAESGDLVRMSWVLPNGVATLRTAYLATGQDPSAAPTTWRLEPLGDVKVVERRRHRRLRSRQSLKLRTQNEEYIPGVLVDLSEGGMRCLVDTVTPAKVTRERLQSQIIVRRQRIGVAGMVAWSRHHGGHVEVGIAFDRIPRHDAEAIRAHVAAAAPAAG